VSWLRIKPVTITNQKFGAACLVHFYSCQSDKIKNETTRLAAHLMKKSNAYRLWIGNYFWGWWRGRYNLKDSDTGSSKVLQEITYIYSMDLSRYFVWTKLAELTAWETYIQRDGEYNTTTSQVNST
jgi:hypothetical protein